ncbi:unnamed protein product, partial [Ixodes persulcatus]
CETLRWWTPSPTPSSCATTRAREDSRAEPFNLEARYLQEAAVPHPDLQLDSFTVNKVVSATDGEASKIK